MEPYTAAPNFPLPATSASRQRLEGYCMMRRGPGPAWGAASAAATANPAAGRTCARPPATPDALMRSRLDSFRFIVSSYARMERLYWAGLLRSEEHTSELQS